MTNNFLLIGVLSAVGLAMFNAPPAMEPARHVPRVGAAETFAVATVTVGHSRPLEARRDPVPFVRNPRVSSSLPVTSPSNETTVAAAEDQAQDDLDGRAAKAAIEQDGYKRVSILGKVSSTAWRAKAYRGKAEIMLTVDGTGRVSMD